MPNAPTPKTVTLQRETTDTPENGDIDDPQIQLVHVDDFAFDEMNLVEIPFCLLKKQASPTRTVALSPNGDEYLQAIGPKYGLPTSFAEPVVLGLLWLTMERNRFQSPKITFPLRELVEDYMYPGQFTRYRAGGRLLKAVERELHRIAATRVHSSRWYDRTLGKHVDIDAAIIDSITTRNEGGRNSQRILEIVWGNKIYDSVRARYTKDFDLKTWLQIEHALDRRLYRWLDRQLHDKTLQLVPSCQKWAKHKMLMQSSKIERGGRTASSYILTKVTEALQRLDGVGFAVRLTADRSKTDYAFRFQRIQGERNEVIDRDPTKELISVFKCIFHGASDDSRRGRTREADRKVAAEWIREYGLEQSMEMVRLCKTLHDGGNYAGQRIFWFSGLQAYEVAAAADYERARAERDGQLRLRLDQARKARWEAYEAAMLKRADSLANIDELRSRARALVESDQAYAYFIKNKLRAPIDAAVAEQLKQLKLAAVGAMTEEDLIALPLETTAEHVIAEHHSPAEHCNTSSTSPRTR